MGHLHSVSTLQRSSKLRPLFIATSSPLRMWKYFSAAFLFFGFKLHDPFPKALDLRWKVCFVLLAFSLFAHTFPIGIFFQLISLFFPSLSLSCSALWKRGPQKAHYCPLVRARMIVIGLESYLVTRPEKKTREGTIEKAKWNCWNTTDFGTWSSSPATTCRHFCF